MIQKIAINTKTNNIKWKIMILQKPEKRINKFEITMTEKYQFQICSMN